MSLFFFNDCHLWHIFLICNGFASSVIRQLLVNHSKSIFWNQRKTRLHFPTDRKSLCSSKLNLLYKNSKTKKITMIFSIIIDADYADFMQMFFKTTPPKSLKTDFIWWPTFFQLFDIHFELNRIQISSTELNVERSCVFFLLLFL